MTRLNQQVHELWSQAAHSVNATTGRSDYNKRDWMRIEALCSFTQHGSIKEIWDLFHKLWDIARESHPTFGIPPYAESQWLEFKDSLEDTFGSGGNTWWVSSR